MTDLFTIRRSLRLAIPAVLMTALLTGLPRLAAAEDGGPIQKICLADARTGEVDDVLARRDPAGVLRSLARGAPELKLDPRLEARNADWFKAGEPIVWNGKTYRPAGEWRESALGRYLRHQGIYRGVPMMSLWPGGDRTLAVLADQETCTFRAYEPEKPAQG